MRWGFSKLLRNVSRKREASSSSTRRPSLDRVTVIRCCVQSPSAAGVSSALERPTARIHAWGGLITALKPLMPNIPRLEILRGKKRSNLQLHRICTALLTMDIITKQFYRNIYIYINSIIK